MRWQVGLFFIVFVIHVQAQIGELEIPLVIPLKPVQIEKLREVASTYSEAKMFADLVTQEAQPFLGTKPNPIKAIHYEGFVHTDPQRIESVTHLQDMARVSCLLKYWMISGDLRAEETLKQYILAWIQTYQLTGNDVNENKLYPLLVAYYTIRDSFLAEDCLVVERWIQNLGALHEDSVKNSNHLTNRYSKHLRLLAIAGMILGKQDWVVASYEGIKRFISNSLYEDGSSLDFRRRDTLTYHASSLIPLIELAFLLGKQGNALYTWSSIKGGSLKKSVDFVVPYAMGEKTRQEWVHSEVALDHRRAEEGIEEYRIGRYYEPASALALMELAVFFDPSLMRVVHHLTHNKAELYPTWQTLINEVARVN